MHYFHNLTQAFGEGWNRYWFTPRTPHVLGLMRVVVGLVALYVVGTYGFDLLAFFGPDGIAPAETVQKMYEFRWRNTLLDQLIWPAEWWVVYLLTMAVLACFTVGLYTRVSSVLALFATLAFFQRAPFLIGEGEAVLAMLMAYLCIAPSGGWLSLDARRARIQPGKRPAPDRPSYAVTVAQRLIQIHLTVIFVMMLLAKLYSDQWWNGMAVWWLATRTESRMIDTTWLPIPLINAWTHAIVLFEATFPWLVRVRLARPLMLAVSLVMWGSLALLTGLGVFCLLMFVAGLAFLEPEELLQCCAAERSAAPQAA